MSYYSEFYFDSDKNIILPFDFFNTFPRENSPETQVLLDEQKQLSVLSEDVMTVKQSKRLDELDKLLKHIDINSLNFSTNPYKNKYGFNCIETHSCVIASNFIEQDRDYNFALVVSMDGEVEIVRTLTSDTIVLFEKNENGYVLKSLAGAKSNNSWVEDKFLDLIYELQLSTTIKDAGNEEIGFVFEDGVQDENDLEADRIYINGVLQK